MILFLLGIGLGLLLGGLMITFFYFDGYRKWLGSQHWVETPCWIETVELSDDGETYQTKATYRYNYQGTTYHSEVVSLYGGSDNIDTFHQDIYQELVEYAELLPDERPNSNPNRNVPPFRCYVNPSKPDQAVIYRVLRWELQAFTAIFALTFVPIGAGLVFGGFWGTISAEGEWKMDWAGDEIRDHSRSWQRMVDVYSLWSAAIIAPLIIAGAFQQQWKSWLLWIYVGLWLVPASVTWKGLRKRASIGHAYLRLEKPFIEPGNVIAGVIHFDRKASIPEKARINLLCEKKVAVQTSDGKSMYTKVVWRSQEQLSPPDDFVGDFPVAQLLFSFDVPLRAYESGQAGNTKYQWKVVFDVPGTMVKGAFEVPVFHTDASRALAAASLDEEVELPSDA